ncbi:MAG: penicillin acylase family protein [Saprospiraceae bacterium]|nr:penicillin acylase family protein [Saprospiraceae bacterium]
MKKTAVGIILLCLGIALMSKNLEVGGNTLPPLGQFLSPVHGFWTSAEAVDGKKEITTLTTKQLEGEVKVLFDERLVPHIFAETDSDLYYAQGYVTAMHRLFQMDMATRSAEGTLSEVIGSRTLELDRERRNQGIGWAAENAVRGWKKHPEYFALVEAYCQGVNDYIATLSPRDYPLEYKFLDFAPSAWSPYRSALFSKVMAIDLAMAESDLENSNARAAFGKAVMDDLMPESNPYQSPVIPSGTSWDFDPIKVDSQEVAASEAFRRGRFRPSPANLGSNNWAVGGEKTADGSVILCSDPHLYLTLPSIWFEIHLQSKEQNCYGVSLPGIPSVIIGFNEDIAWGQTNVGQDVLDWYQVEWVDASRQSYRLDGEIEPVQMRIEEISVRGQEAIRDTIRYTSWGPVMEKGDWKDLAMRWLVHDEPQVCEISALAKLNKASNFEEYREALSHYVAPAQNFVFGSREGDIAMTVAGTLPLRRPGQGRLVQDGSFSANAWPGLIPYEHNPYVKNPPRQFVASANQHSTDDSYPYYYNAFPYFDDYRGRYLNQALEQKSDITVEDMAQLQFDSYSLLAAEGLPVYLEAIAAKSIPDSLRTIIEILRAWDYRYTPEAKAPYIFEQLHRRIRWNAWDEFYEVNDSFPVSFPESWKTIELLKKEPGHAFFDRQGTPEVEGATDIIWQAFTALPSILRRSQYDLEVSDKGSTLKTSLTHIGRFPGFGREMTDVTGNRSALNATSNVTGPSWRMIVTLGETVRAQVVYPGGQSGNPGSPYYENMVEAWRTGKYYSANFVGDPSELQEVVAELNFVKP